MVVSCPVCRARYRLRWTIDARGARVACPRCEQEFVVYPDSAEATGELAVSTLEAPSIRLPDEPRTGLALPGEVPEDELDTDNHGSDAEVVASAVTVPYRRAAPAPPPEFRGPARHTVTPAFSEPRPLEATAAPPAVALEAVRPSAAVRPAPDHRTDPGRGRPVDASTLARRLIEEERIVPADRFVKPPDATAPLRWMVVGAVFTLALVVCGGAGAVGAALSQADPGPAELQAPASILEVAIEAPPPVAATAAQVDGADVPPAEPPPPSEPDAAAEPEPAPSAPRPRRPRTPAPARPAPAASVTPAPPPIEVRTSDLVDPFASP